MYKYIEEKEDKYKLNDLQDKILELVVYFDNFCKENQIEYFLMGGSALGAMRHQGFIPWDDDFDVFMTFDNYEKFLYCAENYLDKEKFYFQKENTYEQPYFFSKIRMNGTTFIEDNTTRFDKHCGIYIDIMCLNNISDCNWKAKIQYFYAAILRTYALIQTGYKTKSLIKNITLKSVKLLVNEKTKNRLLNKIKKFNNRETKRYGHFFGRAKFLNACYRKSIFTSQNYVKFEKLMLPVPNGVQEYLENRFGRNYMELPDKKTLKIYASHAKYWNCNMDYKEYLKNEKV